MAESKVKRIILFTGGIETLEYFTLQLEKAFFEMGYKVLRFDLHKKESEVRRVKKFNRKSETVMLTFNYIAIGAEEHIYQGQKGYIWQQLDIPCFNIVVDHPMYYHDYLPFLPPKFFQLSIDYYHEAYLKKYYPYVSSAGFLPLAGTKLSMATSKPIKERSMDVAFTGNYTCLSKCEPYFHMMNEEYAAFYHKVADRLLQESEKPMESVLLEMVLDEFGKVERNQFAEIMDKARFIDLYVRSYVRGKTIIALVDHGIKVHVFGDGWEDLECNCKENLIIQTEITSEECLKVLADTKIGINVMPWFRNGAHDRIFNSMLNGAYCVTDHSIYLDLIFTNDEVAFFDISKLDELPELINNLLRDEDLLQIKAEKAYEMARNKHTWMQRAECLSEVFERYME